jgi:hypothetical protein
MNEGVNVFDVVNQALDRLIRLLPVPRFDAADVVSLITFLFVVVAVFFVGLIVREVATSYELAPQRRVRYLVRSNPNTRWSTEELERWAAQLSMSRRRVRSHVDRPAHAIRISLVSGPDGPRYTIEGSRRLAPIMRNPALPGLSVTPIRPRGRQKPSSRGGRRKASRGRRS